MYSDKLSVTLYNLLVRDFRSLLGDNSFGENSLNMLNHSIQDFRGYVFPLLGEVDPIRYKAWWQLSNLLKRYRFKSDLYTDEELEKLTIGKFLEFQQVRSTYVPFKTSTKCVLQEARKICREILRNHDEPGPYRRFGTRATVCCPRSMASLDVKLTQPARFSCTSVLKNDLQQFFSETPLTRRISKLLRKNSQLQGIPLKLDIDSLNLVCVPKSWKVKRPITPLSEFGLYMSFGLGGMVETALRKHGLDIRKLQSKHRLLAQRFSLTRSHVTADLSSASDSLRSDILNAVLPRWFYTSLRKTFARCLIIDNRPYHTSSVLPMGNGATFPVETLVFYCLSKAVGNLLKVRGTFSVYGDDLIYPKRIHHVLCRVFDDLGIKMNGEKTFCHSHFRESCGGDYYRGVDVRPALFPSEQVDIKSTSKWKVCQYLYKIYNSFLQRWTEYELPATFAYLKGEIELASGGRIFYVPPSFPVTSGIRSDDPSFRRYRRPCSFQNEATRHFQAYEFECLMNRGPNVHVRPCQIVFLWDWLRQKALLEYVTVWRPQWFTKPRGTSKYSMSRVSAHWFLKSVSLLAREQQAGKEFEEHTSVLSLGSAHVKRAWVNTWT